jgi:Amt family ammonium transporter
LGWFGFNGGSASYIEYVPSVIGTTMMAGAAGGVSSLIFYPAIRGEKPQLGSVINGILGGLVGITASSAYVNITGAVIIGGMSGIVVIFGELFLEKLKIDDPVGAVPVHLGCGWWGTMAVGLFSNPASLEYSGQGLFHSNLWQQLGFQFLGWVIIIGFTLLSSFFIWTLIGYGLYWIFERNKQATSKISFWQKVVRGLRVSAEEEEEGSDGTFADPRLKYKVRF